MLNLNIGRRWGAALAVCGFVLFGAGQAGAAPLAPVTALNFGIRSVEPFGRSVIALPDANALSERWAGAAREIENEMLVLALCEENRSRCTSPEALRFLDIVQVGRAHEGRARLGQINRALNLAVKPASDEALYGATDVWRTPLQLLAMGAGDCEDYAIAKYVALRVAGVPADDLRLVILRDNIRGEEHAVASVRLDGHWLMLDNRRMALVEDVNLLHHQPLFVLDQAGVRQYRDAPLMAGAHQRSVEPAELPKPRAR